MIAQFRFLVVIVALAALAAPAGAAQVVANFDGGNATDVVDAYKGKAGDGWANPWQEFIGSPGSLTTTATAVQSGDVGYNEVAGGGTYLAASMHNTANAGKSFSISRSYAGLIDVSQPHSVEFDFRIDEDLSASFVTSGDRYWLYDDPAPAQGGNYTNTWLIGAHGGTGTNLPVAKNWVLYNGVTGVWDYDSGITAQTGVTYHFKIDVTPATRTWGLTLSDGISPTYTVSGVPWRTTNSATVGGRPQFCTVGNSTDDTRKYSMDNLKVIGTAPASRGGMQAVAARFDGANGSLMVDSYLGLPGDGWRTAWSQTTNCTTITASVLTPWDAAYSEVKAGSNNYLSYSAQQTATAATGRGESATVRDYRTTADPGIDWSKDHQVQFTIRIDDALTTFTVLNDRYQIFDSPIAQPNPNYLCSWLISAYGGTGTECPTGMAKEWGFYNGLHDGTAIVAAQYVDTNVALATGKVYDFTVVVHPGTQTYDATVFDGTTTFSATGLGWQINSTTIGGNLTFATCCGTNGEIRAFSLDDVVITQQDQPQPHAGDANGDGKVDDLDASILAANWQRTGGATWAQADFNKDGNVNDLDASILAANWQFGVGAAVPEPSLAVLALLGLASLAVLRRRGR